MIGYTFLADAVVVLHGLYIAFVVLGPLAVLLGYCLRWNWVRRPGLRLTHLSAIGIVAFEALAGIQCPLTTLEKCLRLQGGQAPYAGDFIAHWVHHAIFLQGEPWMFTAGYLVFAALVAGLFWLVPPFSRTRAASEG